MFRLIAFAAALAFCSATASAEELVRGDFYDGPHAPGHKVSGTAWIEEAADGGYVVVFGDDFISDAGPDVRIILSPAVNPSTDDDIKSAGYDIIGDREALTGAQSYRLPEGTTPEDYNSVAVWCEEFGVMFGAAALSKPN